LFHWQDPIIGFKNISIVWPDVIIVDGYFSKKFSEDYFLRVVGIKTKALIFCLTPSISLLEDSNYINSRIVVSKFHDRLIKDINNAVKPTQKKESLNKISA
jgi:hypothetical protein